MGRLTRKNAPAHSFRVDSTWALSYNTKSRWSCDIIYQAPHCHRFFMSSGEPGNEAIKLHFLVGDEKSRCDTHKILILYCEIGCDVMRFLSISVLYNQ